MFAGLYGARMVFFAEKNDCNVRSNLVPSRRSRRKRGAASLCLYAL